MPATQEISDVRIHDYIKRAVCDVFKTMVGTEAVLVKGPDEWGRSASSAT
jgi:hypothetical protein